MSTPILDDTFAEAFPMTATRLIITAFDQELADHAAQEFCGNASSVIGCDAECGIESRVSPNDSPDGRPGVAVLVFAFSRSALEEAVSSRVGQNVLTCPTTACFAGLPFVDKSKRIKLGALLRFFGDGFQIAKKLDTRRYWRVPVMDGEFLCDDVADTVKGVGGGNLIVTSATQEKCLLAVRQAVAAIREVPNVILPFPTGIVRSGSKVGSKYKQLKASTNDQWCPTLVGQTETKLSEGENAVYEIVIDGLSESDVASAMSVGIKQLQSNSDVMRITAGNYGGKLGPYHFKLHELSE